MLILQLLASLLAVASASLLQPAVRKLSALGGAGTRIGRQKLYRRPVYSRRGISYRDMDGKLRCPATKWTHGKNVILESVAKSSATSSAKKEAPIYAQNPSVGALSSARRGDDDRPGGRSTGLGKLIGLAAVAGMMYACSNGPPPAPDLLWADARLVDEKISRQLIMGEDIMGKHGICTGCDPASSTDPQPPTPTIMIPGETTTETKKIAPYCRCTKPCLGDECITKKAKKIAPYCRCTTPCLGDECQARARARREEAAIRRATADRYAAMISIPGSKLHLMRDLSEHKKRQEDEELEDFEKSVVFCMMQNK
jgi:hypothetical protein